MRPGENQSNELGEPLENRGNLESGQIPAVPLDQPSVAKRVTPAPRSLLQLNRWAVVFTGGFLALIVIAGIFMLWSVGFRANQQAQQPASNYEVKDLTLSNQPSDQLLAVTQATKLSINGDLQVGSTFVLTPTATPSTPRVGQMYYDKDTNTPYVYTGSAYESLLNGPTVQSVGGVTGAITLGAGLQLTGSQLAIAPGVLQSTGVRVTTIQGQSGDIVLTGGSGISVNGTTITNTGVTQILGSNGLVVVQSGGLATLSLPQLLDSTATPTFASINLSGALTIASGGTNTNGGAFSSGGVFYFNGTSFATTAAPGSDGLCLLSGPSGPAFGSCSGAAAGVTSLNGANGVLILDQATANLGTGHVTIQDASTTQKGIAQFTGTDFSVSGGVVSLDATVTKAGNAFNGSSQLVKLDAGGQSTSTGQCLLSTAGGVAFASCPVGGNISSGASQTSGKLTKFDSTTNKITDSIASESGSTITVAGTLVATSLQGGGAAITNLDAGNISAGTLSVSRGGTGQVTFATNSILLGNGTAGLGSLTPGADGECLVIVSGAPAFTTCTGAGGVSSVNTGTGALTLQGANGVSVSTAVSGVITITGPTIGTGVSSLNGATGDLSVADASEASGIITINTANTSGQKGIASYNSSNFTVSSGVVNTIQGIGTSATPTFGGLSLQNANATLSGVGASGTTALTFATQSGNDTKTITIPNTSGTVAVSATGPLSLSAAGVLSCPSCLTSGGGGGTAGVSSVNSLTGALSFVGANGITVSDNGTDTITITAPTAAAGVSSLNTQVGDLVIDNTTTASGHIIIDDATTSTKGIASFNSSDFSVASGAVSLDTSVTKAGNTFNGINQLVQLNGSGILPALNGSQLTNLNASNIANGTLSVARGGTGAGTFTVNGILFGNGTSALGVTAAGTEGQCLIAHTGTAPTFATCTGAGGVSSLNTLTGDISLQAGGGISITPGSGTLTIANTGVTQIQGTTNQITASAGTGSITLSLPQNIHTGAAVQFASATLTGAAGLTLGQGSTATGKVTFKNLSNNFSTILQSGGAGADVTFTLPSADGTANQCLKTNASGVLSFGDCLTGSTGGSGGVVSLQGATSGSAISGAITINNAVSSGAAITIDNASSTAKGIASFNSTDFSVTTGAVSLATVAANKGGTGITSYTTGDLIYASGATTLSKLSAGALNTCLMSGGPSTAPTWGNCDTGAITGVGTYSTTNTDAKGASIASNQIIFQSASASAPGMVDTGTQTFAGNKTFSSSATTQTGLQVSANSLTTGGGLKVSTTSTSITGGNLLEVTQSSAYSGTFSSSSQLLNVNRTITGPAAAGTVVLDSTSENSHDWSGDGPSGFGAHTLTSTHTISGTNRLLIVSVYAYTPTAVTFTSGSTYSLTKIAEVFNGSYSISQWVLLAPPTGAGTVSVSEASGTYLGFTASSWTNVDQTTPYSTPITNTGTNTSVTTSVPTATGQKVVDVLLAGGGTALTPGAGQTAVGTQFIGIASSYKAAAGSSTSMTWSWSGSLAYKTIATALHGSTIVGSTDGTLTGSVASIASSCLGCTEASSVLNLQQANTLATGSVLSLQNSGLGADIQLGSGILRNASDSTAALSIQNSAGTETLFKADTTNNRIVIGNAAGTGAATTTLVLDAATSDPTGTAGAMYYNTTSNIFKCYTTGWFNCSGSGVSVVAGSGTDGKLAKFSGGNLADSGLSEASTTLTYSGNAIINAASGFTGNLLDLQLNGTSKLSVNQAGNTTVGGTLSVTGNTTASGTLAVTGVTTLTGQLNANGGIVTNNQNITAGTGTISGGTINAATLLQLGGVDINTAGTLSNVAYENQANVFTAANTFRNTTNSTTALQIQSATSDVLLNADTTNMRLSVGNATGSDARLHVEGDDAGITWTSRTTPASQWYSVTYGNGVFVAVGNGAVASSSDGITWTSRTPAEANFWDSVTYGNGLFVAVSTTGTNRVMTSPDGITWTARAAAQANTWSSVTYGGGLFVAVSTGGTNRVMTSPDGITWTVRNAAQANTWNSVTYGGGLFVAVSYPGTNRVMTSPDGITWTSRTPPSGQWYSVTYGNGLFVAVGDGTVMTSPDGITWTSRTPSEFNFWDGVTYGGGLFVAVSNFGTHQVMTSSDGITWVARTAAQANSWNAITYGGGLFVAVSSDGTSRAMTSSEPAALRVNGNTALNGNLVANAATGFTGNLLDLQLNGTSKLSVTEAGNATLAGTLTVATIQSAASTALTLTGNAASTLSTTAGNLTLQAGSGTVSLGSSTNLTASGALTVAAGGSNQNLTLQGSGTGSVIAKSSSNSTTAFRIQNASSVDVFNVDTTNKSINVGAPATFTGTTITTGSGFTLLSSPSVGGGPWGVVSADFDGDGDKDLAATTGSNTVAILLNNGSGTFTLSSSPAVGSNPNWIAVGDVDGDGDQDLVTANYSGNNISILKNNGSASFTVTTGPSVGAGNHPMGIAMADFDGDGDQDVAVTEYDNNVVAIMTNSGTGTYSIASTPAVGTNPGSVAVADLDGDGDQDLAVSNFNGGISILKNNGSATFSLSSSPVAGANPSYVAIADVDGDGDKDLAVANSGATTVSILKNNGSATFSLSSSPSVSSAPASLAFADFDNDGDTDLAVTNSSASTVTVLANGGTGTFTTASSPSTGIGPNGVVALDFDGDGDQDLAVANGTSSTVSILKNNQLTVTTGTISATASVVASSTDKSALTVQAASGQVADLVRIQDASATPYLTITSNGNIGIGNVASLSSATAKLSVVGAVSATSFTANGTAGLTSTCSGTQTLNGLTVVGGIVTAGTCTTNGSDLAEAYNSTDDLVAGELVMASAEAATTVNRASNDSSSKLLGIVSTDPSKVIGTDQVPNGYPIALSGRVPTKVNTEGGVINIGDKITISSVPGVGKKAMGRGMVVGTALESFSGTGTGTIEVFVHVTYYEPTDIDTLQAQTATLGDLNVSGMATINNLTVTGLATVHDLAIGGHVITTGGQPTNEVQAAAGMGATVIVDGTDTLGTITITTGNTPTAGEMARLIFSELYTASPRVVLSASNDNAAGMRYFKGATGTDGFMLNFKDAPAANTTYTFDYFIGQ